MNSLLLRDITKEILNVLVFKHSFVEKIFPDPVELKLACLDLSICSLEQKEPELFDVLKTTFELVIVSEYNVKNLLVLTLSVNESLKSLARLLDVFPCCITSFSPYLLIANRVI